MIDMMLEMAKQQGYVPLKCILPGAIVMGLINKGENPCWGCNQDRSVCEGQPKKEQDKEVTDEND